LNNGGLDNYYRVYLVDLLLFTYWRYDKNKGKAGYHNQSPHKQDEKSEI
jgi:hypothetical protein